MVTGLIERMGDPGPIVPHAGVLWTVRQFAQDFRSIGNRENPKTTFVNSFDIVTPPRCLECQTELEQTHQFFGGYRWECVNVDSKKEIDSAIIERPIEL